MWKKCIIILLFSLSFVTLILAENISTDDYDHIHRHDDYDHQTKVEKEGKICKTSNKNTIQSLSKVANNFFSFQ